MSDLSKQYAILRHEKLRLTELSAAAGHNERRQAPLNAVPTLLGANVDLLPPDSRTIRERWEARMTACGSPTLRTNAVAAVELFLGFSPEAGDRVDAEQWGRDCLAYASQVWGADNILSARLHLDEKTPHVSILAVPLIEKSIRGGPPKWRLVAAHWLDGREKLTGWQTRFYQQVGRRHGLERGEEGSKRRHVPQKDCYKAANDIEAAVASAVATTPPSKLLEATKAHQERVQAHLNTQLVHVVEAAKQGTLAQASARAAAASERKRKEEVDRRRRAEAERDAAWAEAKRQKREQEDRLREIDVSLVLSRILGVQPTREGSQLVVETPEVRYVVAADEHRFIEFRAGRKSGSGAISATMGALGCEFTEAVRWLVTHFEGGTVESCVRAAYERTVRQTVAEAVARPVTLAEQLTQFAPIVPANWPAVRRYLVGTRCLSGSWVDDLHARGDLWANHYGSACFALRDKAEELTGAVVRGTTSRFLQTIGTKAEGWFSFCLSPDAGARVVATESPIEALSVAALEGDLRTVYGATAGKGGLTPILEFAREHRAVVVTGQNHDDAGEEQAAATAAACAKVGLRCVRLRPQAGVDWNDTLVFLRRELHRVCRTGTKVADRLRAAWRRTFHMAQLDRTAVLARDDAEMISEANDIISTM